MKKKWWFPCQICHFPAIILFASTFPNHPPKRAVTASDLARCRSGVAGGWPVMTPLAVVPSTNEALGMIQGKMILLDD